MPYEEIKQGHDDTDEGFKLFAHPARVGGGGRGGGVGDANLGNVNIIRITFHIQGNRNQTSI
jgi:hypothetical protein